MTSALDLLSAAALSRSLSDEQQIPVDPSLYDSPSESAIQPDLQSIGIPPTDEPDGDQTEDEELGEVANVEYPRNHEPKLEARVAKEPTSSLPPPIQTSHKLPAFATFLPGPDSLKLIISASSNPPSLKALPPLPAFDATFPFLSSSFPALPPLPAVDAVPHRVPEDSGIIRCVCSFTSDDGFTIQCDGCNAWLHASCDSISPDEVPEEYLCGICDPLAATQRGVDSRKAEEGQRKRVQEEDGKERDGLKRRASIGVGAMERASSTPRPKQARRSLTTEENPGPPPSAAHDSAPMTPATGSILRDAIGRRRRVGKQPATPSAGPGPGRPRSAATLANAALNDMSNASVPHRINTSVRNVREMSEEEEESGDERYESWQYEYTPVDSNLWPERQLIERLEAVLVDLSSGDSVTTAAMKDLWDRQSAERSTLGLPRDSRLPHLYDLNPILLDSLPQSIPTAVRPLANVAFHLVPPAAAFYIPPTTKVSQCPYPRPTVHALYSTTAIAPNTFITEIRGQIESLDAYRARPLNQYSMLGVPKQGVRALPHPWSLVVDSRNFGNEARFARSGCHPNAVIKAIRLTSSGREENALGEESQWGEQRNVGDVGLGVVFAIYSLVEIGRKEEIVLPWDWDDGHIVHALPSLLDTPPPPPGVEGPDLEPLSRKMSAVTTTILGTTSCACERKRDCALFWMCRAASAATSVGRGGSSKREPFSTLLLNALSGSRDEEKGGRGKTKVKKSDVGILLGLERGWIKESAKAIGAVEELVAMEVDELVPSHLDFDIVTSPLTPLTSPKKSRRRDNDQDVDSDSSDLTEPLPHQSDSESPRKKVRQIAPVEDDEEEEEEIVRPPPRRKLATKKPSSKDVGPARKKLKEREIEAERKLKRRKGESEEKVKLKTKTKTKVVIREREKDPKEMAMLAREKEVRDRFKEKSEVTNESDHGVDGRKRSSTFSTGSRPTKIDLPFAKLRQSRSPSPLIPPTAPARIETSSSFDFSGSSFKPNMTGSSHFFAQVGLKLMLMLCSTSTCLSATRGCHRDAPATSRRAPSSAAPTASRSTFASRISGTTSSENRRCTTARTHSHRSHAIAYLHTPRRRLHFANRLAPFPASHAACSFRDRYRCCAQEYRSVLCPRAGRWVRIRNDSFRSTNCFSRSLYSRIFQFIHAVRPTRIEVQSAPYDYASDGQWIDERSRIGYRVDCCSGASIRATTSSVHWIFVLDDERAARESTDRECPSSLSHWRAGLLSSRHESYRLSHLEISLTQYPRSFRRSTTRSYFPRDIRRCATDWTESSASIPAWSSCRIWPRSSPSERERYALL